MGSFFGQPPAEVNITLQVTERGSGHVGEGGPDDLGSILTLTEV